MRIDGVHRAVVTEVRDPEGLGRVQVAPERELRIKPLWARVATLMAGEGRGTWLLPESGDEVLVAFEAGDPASPVVLGSLWSAGARPPESDPELRVVRTRGGLEIRLDDAAGQITVTTNEGATVRLARGGVVIESASKVQVSASQVEVSAGMVDVSAGMTKFSGVVQCDTLIANSVVASSYTPGAGNIA